MRFHSFGVRPEIFWMEHSQILNRSRGPSRILEYSTNRCDKTSRIPLRRKMCQNSDFSLDLYSPFLQQIFRPKSRIKNCKSRFCGLHAWSGSVTTHTLPYLAWTSLRRHRRWPRAGTHATHPSALSKTLQTISIVIHQSKGVALPCATVTSPSSIYHLVVC